MLKFRGWSLRTYAVCAMVVLVSAVGATIAVRSYERTVQTVYDKSLEQTYNAAEDTAVEFHYLLSTVREGLSLLVLTDFLRTPDETARMRALPMLQAALRAAPAAISFYYADNQGNYLSLAELAHADPPARETAPPGTVYVSQNFVRKADVPNLQTVYLRADLSEIMRVPARGVENYDPRERPWFKQAISVDTMIRTRPYRFYLKDTAGITIAKASDDDQLVVGADLNYRLLDESLIRSQLTPNARMVLVNRQGQILASNDPDLYDRRPTHAPRLSTLKKPVMSTFARLLDQLEAAQEQDVALEERVLNDKEWRVELVRLPNTGTSNIYLGAAVPKDDLLSEVRSVRDRMFLETLAILLLSIPLAIWLSRAVTEPIIRLTRRAERLRFFDFARADDVKSEIYEMQQLNAALSASRDTLAGFIDIITRLNGDADFEHLMATLLRATTEASHARGGLLYVRTAVDGVESLRLADGLWETCPLKFYKLDSAVLMFSVTDAIARKQSIHSQANAEHCRQLGLPASASLTVPLFNRKGQAVGALVLFLEQALDNAHISFIEALAGFAAVALETRGLIGQQKALFESLIQLVASAIDAKSPYTGGHCERVPEAAKLLAEAACAETQGPYAQFDMSDDDWHALHIGAWLHDCGKVTTPEYVVDKATKLETIYDRIHEIRLRFEVLKRDAQINYLEALNAGADRAEAIAARDAQWQQLEEEFAFIARCNTGSEFLGEEQLQRLQAIAKRRWLRTLDDRLGISGEERVRKEAQPVVELPVWEDLLADRPEHKIARPAADCLDPDNRFGFNMQVPEYLYDRGELKNLSIRRGTLTEEERYKINEHIIQTIKMLNALPFPHGLEQVPEIAGGHHERIDGKGYPCGLTGEQLSPQAKMMAIADVFEALTARDRPYKPSKTLSQALRIMSGMCADGHLDANLLSIFIRSGACMRYADRFLAPEQIDCRDLMAFLPENRTDQA